MTEVMDASLVGAGVYLVGERPVDVANSFDIPGYVRLDAFAAYHWKLGASRLTAQLNVKNILDKEYFFGNGPLDGPVALFPGEPLTFIGSLRFEY